MRRFFWLFSFDACHSHAVSPVTIRPAPRFRRPRIGFSHRLGYNWPDFAVEIRSPSDNPKDIRAKIDEYLHLGVQAVWDVDPATRRVIVHRPGCEPHTFSVDDILTAPGLLPNFALRVGEIFAG
ncbi:MAG: Uma2 family endonuclease [Planctomycetaceae bacterium]|nr:Uma2 family endonuclease [Planctomycetaceae bacterium]